MSLTKGTVQKMIHQMTKNFSKYSAFLYFFSLFGFSTILKRAGIYKSKGLCSVEMLKESLRGIVVCDINYKQLRV